MDIHSVWLKDEVNRKSYFPDVLNTKFEEFPINFGNVTLIVEGCEQRQSTNSPRPIVGSPLSAPSAAPRPSFSSSARKPSQSVTIKIVQAKMRCLSNGKIEFTNVDQTFVDITETTANVNHLNFIIQRKWGTNHALVTADGLKIDDCSATQGKVFYDL